MIKEETILEIKLPVPLWILEILCDKIMDCRDDSDKLFCKGSLDGTHLVLFSQVDD